jgi:hypothetical protein
MPKIFFVSIRDFNDGSFPGSGSTLLRRRLAGVASRINAATRRDLLRVSHDEALSVLKTPDGCSFGKAYGPSGKELLRVFGTSDHLSKCGVILYSFVVSSPGAGTGESTKACGSTFMRRSASDASSGRLLRVECWRAKG